MKTQNSKSKIKNWFNRLFSARHARIKVADLFRARARLIMPVLALCLYASVANVSAQDVQPTNIPGVSTYSVGYVLPSQPDLMATNDASILRGIVEIGRGIYNLAPTNNDVFVYGTYVLKPQKFGFGAGDAYNLTGGIGIIGGVDYIDHFVGFNGGIRIKKTFTWHHLNATVFGISALLTPIAGGGAANGGLGTANSVGVSLNLYKQFDVSGLYGTRTGAGSYGGGYVNFAASWRF